MGPTSPLLMACYHKQRRWILGGINYTKEDGTPAYKDRIAITPIDRLNPDPNLPPFQDQTEIIPNQVIRCGKCIGCRLDDSKQWAVRSTIEAEKYDFNWFVTLTYDPDHVPIKVNPSTGEVIYTLNKKHLSEFMKRLRSRFDYYYGDEAPKVRFFGCGEYGSKTMRPHYHLLLFNVPFWDLRKQREITYGDDKESCFTAWKSDVLEDAWGMGLTEVSAFSYQTAAYVARYILKKDRSEEARAKFKELGYTPEFTLMSRKPGIARDYYEENKDKIYENDELFVNNGKKVLKLHSLRYYDRLFDLEDPETLKEIKEARRRMAEEQERGELQRTQLTAKQLDEIKEKKKLAAASRLVRVLD